MEKTEQNIFNEQKQNELIINLGKFAGKSILDLLKIEEDYLRWYSQSPYCNEFQKTYITNNLPEPVITFGKYKGKLYKELKEENPNYFNWLSTKATNVFTQAAIKSVS